MSLGTDPMYIVSCLYRVGEINLYLVQLHTYVALNACYWRPLLIPKLPHCLIWFVSFCFFYATSHIKLSRAVAV